jgi:hypothetical protein
MNLDNPVREGSETVNEMQINAYSTTGQSPGA